jgi:hypothetical protein
MLAPASPVPDLSVADVLEDLHDSVLPVVVSFSVVVPDVPVIDPPGETVHVAAKAGAAVRPIVRAAAPPVARIAAIRLCMCWVPPLIMFLSS